MAERAKSWSRRLGASSLAVWFAILVGTGCGSSSTGSTASADSGQPSTKQDIAVVSDTDDAVTDAPDEVDSDSQTDATQADEGETAPPPDGSDTAAPACPGGPTCPCASDGECDSGACLQTPAGQQCAQSCASGSCPQGFACKPFGAVDPISVCVPLHLSLCAPCTANADCQVQGANDAWCLDRGDEGAFCGGTCGKDADCPQGYQCLDGKPVGGGAPVKACQPAAGAECTCSAWATKLGVATPCKSANDLGSCSGKRFCGPQGLTACDAPAAKAEVCNGDDDNCNGKIDDISATAICLKKAFDSKGSGAPCKVDSDCTAPEACDSGVCKVLIGACPGKPTCTTAGSEVCLDAKTPTYEACNGQDDDCDGLTDEGFAWTDLATGATANVGEACGVGACAGGVVQCVGLGQSGCTTAGKAGAEKCNGQDDNCNGQTDEAACDDGDACTADSCNPQSLACEHTAVGVCDDKNPCTADSCDKATGQCQAKLTAGASCSDGNACTVGDSCGSDATGQAICQPGTAPANCDDGNLCTDDSCDPGTGCVSTPNGATQTCYDGSPGSSGVGLCHSGKKICKDGQLGQCIDQVVPAASEACDGQDNDCDGQTDEICKGEQWQGGFATLAGTAAGSPGVLTIATGADTGTGELWSKGATDVLAGLARWLLDW